MLEYQEEVWHSQNIQWQKNKTRAVIYVIITGICIGVCFYTWIDSGNRSTGSIGRTIREDLSAKCNNAGIWNEQNKTCKCTFGWVGKECGVWHNDRCYFGNGKDYRGKLSTTKSGKTCKPWTTEENHRFRLGRNGIGIHNHCRNPNGEDNGIWCYVGSSNFTEYCNATICPDGLKKLLSMNAGEMKDGDTPAASRYLLEPVIAGVCAGVVILLVSISLCEFARRRRRLRRSEKLESINNHENNQRSNTITTHKKEEDSAEVKTLGGIFMVDVDMEPERTVAFPNNNFAEDTEITKTNQECCNDVFVRDGFSRIPRPPQKRPPPLHDKKPGIARDIKKPTSSDFIDSKKRANPDTTPACNLTNDIRQRTRNQTARKKRRRRRAQEPPDSSSDSEGSAIASPGESSATSNGLSSPASDKSGHARKRRRRRKPRASTSPRNVLRNRDFARFKKNTLNALEPFGNQVQYNYRTRNTLVSELPSLKKCNFEMTNEQSIVIERARNGTKYLPDKYFPANLYSERYSRPVNTLPFDSYLNSRLRTTTFV